MCKMCQSLPQPICFLRGVFIEEVEERAGPSAFLHQFPWWYEMNQGRKFYPFGNERTDPTLQSEQDQKVQVVLAHTEKADWENKRCGSILNSDALHREHVMPHSSRKSELGHRLVISYDDPNKIRRQDSLLESSLREDRSLCLVFQRHHPTKLFSTLLLPVPNPLVSKVSPR